MKTGVKLAILFVVAGVVMFAVFIARQVSSPESEMIAKEREKMALALDNDRVEKGPSSAIDAQDRLNMLDHRLAEAYNREKKPDQAISILQRLIGAEELKEKTGVPRRSRSYFKQAWHYEALQQAYYLKGDEASAGKAAASRDKRLLKASALQKAEVMAEGKLVSPLD